MPYDMWEEFKEKLNAMCQEHIDQQPDGGMSNEEMAEALEKKIKELRKK